MRHRLRLGRRRRQRLELAHAGWQDGAPSSQQLGRIARKGSAADGGLLHCRACLQRKKPTEEVSSGGDDRAIPNTWRPKG
jgi:hypothetical protein